MAWRSSGTTNEEMVDNMKRFGVIRSPHVEAAFRDVDRAHFCPRNLVDMAYSDQPLREGDIHLSAPHMYGTICEQLDILPQQQQQQQNPNSNEESESSSMSFLNVGSGTGYLSCIIARMLSKSSVLYGIELQQDVLDHCMASMERWKAATTSRFGHDGLPHMEFVHGNGLHIDAEKGESIVGYDRIYVGSSIDKRAVTKLTAMLRLGGILIAPVDDELVKIIRIKQTKESLLPNGRNHHSIDLADDYTKEVISAVRFAALAKRPRTVSIVPSRVWAPEIHMSYPKTFQKVCKTILLCANSPTIQPLEQPEKRINLASKLPKLLWMEILSYTHHTWFEQSNTSVEMLQKRLAQEQANAARAADAIRTAEQRIRVLEQERDGYRLLALRWQTRFQQLAGTGNDSSMAFARLMDAMQDFPPAFDHGDDDDSSDNPNANNVAGRMDSSDDDDEESNASDADDHDDSSVIMRDDEGDEVNNHDNDDFSVNMELSVTSDPVGRTTKTVSITSEPSP